MNITVMCLCEMTDITLAVNIKHCWQLFFHTLSAVSFQHGDLSALNTSHKIKILLCLWRGHLSIQRQTYTFILFLKQVTYPSSCCQERSEEVWVLNVTGTFLNTADANSARSQGREDWGFAFWPISWIDSRSTLLYPTSVEKDYNFSKLSTSPF